MKIENWESTTGRPHVTLDRLRKEDLLRGPTDQDDKSKQTTQRTRISKYSLHSHSQYRTFISLDEKNTPHIINSQWWELGAIWICGMETNDGPIFSGSFDFALVFYLFQLWAEYLSQLTMYPSRQWLNSVFPRMQIAQDFLIVFSYGLLVNYFIFPDML
jgi:hypothetical protein